MSAAFDLPVIAFVALLLLGLAAIAWGVDSRPQFDERRD
jgi:hypothetical protein